MDWLHVSGWAAFAAAFALRLGDELLAKLVFRLTGPLAKRYEAHRR